MRARARLHADQAGRQRRNEFQQPGARHTGTHQGRPARGVHTVNGKHVLGKIDSDSDNSHGLPLLNKLMRHLHFPSWHFVAGRRNTRLVRDGEVPLSATSFASEASDIIGTWTWTIAKTGCTMTRTFRGDGSTAVVNGKKNTTGTFNVKWTRERTGRMLVHSVATDDGGTDCDDTASSTVGKRYISCVHTDGSGLHMCLDSARSACLGPYREALNHQWRRSTDDRVP